MQFVLSIFPLTLLLNGVCSQQCIGFTTADVEGPYFVSNVPIKVLIGGAESVCFEYHGVLSIRLLLTMILTILAREQSSEER